MWLCSQFRLKNVFPPLPYILMGKDLKHNVCSCQGNKIPPTSLYQPSVCPTIILGDATPVGSSAPLKVTLILNVYISPDCSRHYGLFSYKTVPESCYFNYCHWTLFQGWQPLVFITFLPILWKTSSG